MHEDVECEFRPLVSLFYRSLNLAHVAGDSGDAEQSGLCIQEVV
jgi:hypothetical protein